MTFKSWNRSEELTFEYSQSFQMYGFTFAIHRPIFMGKFSETSWAVSEVTCGLRVAWRVADTIKQAEKEARKCLREKGRETVERAVAKGRRSAAQFRGRLARTGDKRRG